MSSRILSIAAHAILAAQAQRTYLCPTECSRTATILGNMFHYRITERFSSNWRAVAVSAEIHQGVGWPTLNSSCH